MIGFERYVREIDFIQKWVSFLSSITFDCLQRDLLMDFLFFRVSVGVTSGKKMIQLLNIHPSISRRVFTHTYIADTVA